MERHSLYFTGPGEIEVRKENIESPEDNYVLVENKISAISSGTEMLFYEEKLDENTLIDNKITGLKKDFNYPFKYGYSSVGEIKEIGNKVSKEWKNKLIFSFHPHESKFLANIENITPVPDRIEPKEACFLPSVETAINLLLDGNPIIGENILVLGQGIIGLLTTSLLNEMAVETIVTSDRHQIRREISRKFGSDYSLDTDAADEKFFTDDRLPESGADLSYEVSGNPGALERAISLTGPEGRIVVGSWYGDQNPEIGLGTEFHRKRLNIISSQVSRINPELSERWDRNRRIDLAWKYVDKLDLDQLITHEFSLEEANEAYNLIKSNKEEVLQAVFRY